jgi:uncharacterized protein YqjF (DUF2071 family)
MIQSWTDLTFLHWAYSPEVLQAHLPAGLEVDRFNNSAWLSMTPFYLRGLRLPFLPALPWLSHFPETNLRTYVAGPEGPGIWFFSLEAARLAAVAGARLTFGLPYRWARMQVRRERDTMHYSSVRVQGRGHTRAVVAIGSRVSHRTDLQTFLVERYRLYSILGGRLASAVVEHPPWILHDATLLSFEESLRAETGLPDLSPPALLNYSPGVTVRVGAIKPCGSGPLVAFILADGKTKTNRRY